METELFLPGLDESVISASEGLFLAIFPSVRAVGEIRNVAGKLCEKHRLNHKLRPESHWHITLGYLGPSSTVSKGDLQSLEHACKSTADLTGPFEIELDCALSFGGGAFVLKSSSEALVGFRQKLLSEMVKQGCRFHRKDPRFNPHLTLLYDEKKVTEDVVGPVRWTAKEFALILSHVGDTKYDMLARWSFTGDWERVKDEMTNRFDSPD